MLGCRDGTPGLLSWRRQGQPQPQQGPLGHSVLLRPGLWWGCRGLLTSFLPDKSPGCLSARGLTGEGMTGDMMSFIGTVEVAEPGSVGTG